MPVHHTARAALRAAAAGAGAPAAVLALAGPAAAHAEVEADTLRALAENVTLTFVSEAESDSGGFTRVRVVLPEGIGPGDVALAGAPAGWKLTASADGYTIGGPALKTGVDAAYRIRVRQLPDAELLVFKTVETYSDGKISRWIELPTGGAEPEEPAPVLKLEPPAAGATPLTPGPSADTASAPGTAPSTDADRNVPAAGATPAQGKAAAEDGGPSTAVIAGSAAAVLAALGGGWWLARRRSSGTG
ncbi:DUF1775 domain-containing protein [Streptomyces sp. MUM 136J]|uniref:DUF1775 domain-containing protein n=1 Tax=Streptomyces sp. MUM 136J TaxID=2791992 RepID=UPI001F033A86|nr:DUF1775 domain-containing protein [Streptomyces sp. MUM 136J]MCH0571282.1 DUF1775 domain-containing protein [Streptomyces sp. MUM 136J]